MRMIHWSECQASGKREEGSHVQWSKVREGTDERLYLPALGATLASLLTLSSYSHAVTYTHTLANFVLRVHAKGPEDPQHGSSWVGAASQRLILPETPVTPEAVNLTRQFQWWLKDTRYQVTSRGDKWMANLDKKVTLFFLSFYPNALCPVPCLHWLFLALITLFFLFPLTLSLSLTFSFSLSLSGNEWISLHQLFALSITLTACKASCHMLQHKCKPAPK